MNREKFETLYANASTVVDFDRYTKEMRRTIDPSPVYIGDDGTRNLIIVMEELAELSQQISKHVRGKTDRLGLIEEVGDVYLALVYVMEICHISEAEINKAMNVKINRLEETEDIYQ